MIADQKRTAQSIINIFETGSPDGDYAKVTVLRGDPGHLTYGRSQTTLASGNLHRLLRDYCKADGAKYAAALSPYLTAIADAPGNANLMTRLDGNRVLRKALRQAGSDPVMRQVQDAFFDRVYWTPAVNAAAKDGLVLPLSVAVVYDSVVHGSWAAMRRRVLIRLGSVETVGETAWITKYVAVRRYWLANHSIRGEKVRGTSFHRWKPLAW